MTRFPSAMTALAIVFAASTAAAIDPDLSGTWVCDPERSSWSDGKFPADRFKLAVTLTFTEDGRMVYDSINTTFPDKPYLTHFEATLDDAVHPFLKQSRFNEVAARRLGDREIEVRKMKDGDVIAAEKWTFLPDGRTLIRWGVAKDAKTKVSKVYEEYFVKAD